MAPLGEPRLEPTHGLTAQRHVDGRLVGGLRHAGNLVGAAHDLLGEEEAGREIAVGARRPHRDDEGLTVQPDGQRRLRGGAILGPRPLAVAHPLDLDRSPGAGHAAILPCGSAEAAAKAERALPTPAVPVPGFRCPVPGARCPMPDARCPVPDSRLPTPDSRLPTPDSRHPLL